MKFRMLILCLFILPLLLTGNQDDNDYNDDYEPEIRRENVLRVIKVDPPAGANINSLTRIIVTFNHPVPKKYIMINYRNGNCPATGVTSSLLITADFIYNDNKKERGVCYGMSYTTRDNRTFIITPRFPIRRHTFNNGGGDPNFYTIIGAKIHFTIRTKAMLLWKKGYSILTMKPVRDIYGNRMKEPFYVNWTIPAR